MTCQKQIHEEGLSYPRTCPDCGSGPCRRELEFVHEVRYCIDCRFVHTTYAPYPVKSEYYCIHPSIVSPPKIDLVSKIKIYSRKNLRSCRKERAARKGLCGIQGILWEKPLRRPPPPIKP